MLAWREVWSRACFGISLLLPRSALETDCALEHCPLDAAQRPVSRKMHANTYCQSQAGDLKQILKISSFRYYVGELLSARIIEWVNFDASQIKITNNSYK